MAKFILFVSIVFLILVVLLFSFGSSRRDPDEIVIWTQDLPAGRAVLDSLLTEFMQQHLGTKVSEIYYETEELRSNFIVAAVGGSGPDLIYGPSDQVGPFEVMKIIQPLEHLLSEDSLADFIDEGKVTYKEHLYALADRVGNHLTLVYNKKLMSKPPQTTDELIELGLKLTQDWDGDGIIDQYALAWNYVEPFFFIPFLAGYGGWVMDDRGNPTLDTPATVSACQFIVDLRTKYKIIPRECDLDVANTLFKAGRAAMVINGPWSWGNYRENGVDIGLSRIPKVSATGLWSAPMISATAYSINVNTRDERLEKTLEVLRYITSRQAQLRYTRVLTTIPARKSAQEDAIVTNDELLKRSKEQVEVGKPMPIDPAMRAIWDAMRPPYQSVLNGSLSPQEAARRMQEDAIKKIAEMQE